ncbi:cation acetate symporter [Glutamicibacter sp. JC586]|uniref:sodium/solute symporter n=1 Tax=Glutamicibacter sp. JC586 TaxID=2590552 RepID=UPI00135CF3A2|nr:cation acetate symporter [Glutamicibacter sp. JC586]
MLIAFYGLRISRTTSDFYVASRTVRPWWNASAIGGEYLSAASFLGVAGLIVLSGESGLWFPIGYTAGYLMLLLFVAAPLRRSRAYTIPDFAQIRFEDSALLRKLTTYLVVVICWLYIVPQMHGAALTLSIATGLPGWVGPIVVAVVVCVTVLSGGMRSVTFVQAFQYWFKLAALVIPTLFLLARAIPEHAASERAQSLSTQLESVTTMNMYETISIILALLFGTLGLPHVLVRFYTNPTGSSARTTTVIVLCLLSAFYLLPTTLGVLGILYTPELGAANESDATILLLPGRLLDGVVADALTAIVVGGAFAAFLSTTSGLVVSLAGAISQEFFNGTVRGFRISTILATALPVLIAVLTSSLALAGAIGNVFAFTASTICPLLLLGIWWRSLTAKGAIAGLLTGAITCGLSLSVGIFLPTIDLWWVHLLRQPAAWSVPLAFVVMIVVSRGTRRAVPQNTDRVMALLHVPDPSSNS